MLLADLYDCPRALFPQHDLFAPEIDLQAAQLTLWSYL
jgi:hypothetical protein